MKFCTYSHVAHGEKRPGVLTADGATIVDLGGSFDSMLAIIKGGDEAKVKAKSLQDRAETRVALGEAKLHAPVPVTRTPRSSRYIVAS